MNERSDFSPGPLTATAGRGLSTPIARLLFALGCGMSLVAAAVYDTLAVSLPPGTHVPLVGACLLLAAVFGLGMVLHSRAALGKVVLAIGWSSMSLVTVTAVCAGEGLHSTGLGFYGLIACLVTVLTSVRAGVFLALGGMAQIMALYLAETHGWLPGVVQSRQATLSVSLHAMLLAASVVAGTQISRIVQRAVSDADKQGRHFRELMAIAADWYWELDADLRFSCIAEHGPQGWRRTEHPYLGQRPWEVENLSIDSVGLSLYREDLEAHRPFSDLPLRDRLRSGHFRHVSMSGSARYDEDGAFAGYWGVGRDTTSEVQAREAHTASEMRYRELFALSPTPLVLHQGGITLLANSAAARLFGLPSAEAMVGFNITQQYDPSYRGVLRERVQTLSTLPLGKSLDTIECVMHSADGRAFTAQVNSARVSTRGQPATLTLYHDISERVATEAALRRSEALLSHLFATSPDFITLSDMETSVYKMVNPAFTRILGYSAEEVIGQSGLSLGIWQQPSDRAKMVEVLQANGGVSEIETLFNHKSGRPVRLLLSAAKFSMDGHDYLVLNGRDVSEAQRARLEHEAILKNASIGIALTRGWRFVQVNPCFDTMFGRQPGELIGQDGASICGGPQVFAQLVDHVATSLQSGKPVEMELELMRLDGSMFWCRLLAQAVDPLRPTAGGTIWIAEDVTERRQIDQALAEARDVAEAANRAKSAFLANTSHEIRTPLNGLLGLATLAMQPELEAPRRQQYLAQIQDSAQSLAGIISDILDLSKIEAGRFSLEAVPFDLRALLSAVHHAYAALAQARSLTLTLEIADDVPATVCGDPVRLRQILSNFITNGLKFTARGGVQIVVAMSANPHTPQRVRLTVNDSGLGIDEATQKRLFQPFMQADESITRRYGGTGLGLSICKELATLMAGQVGVSSTPGQGSSFWAEVPLPAVEMPLVDLHAEARDIQRLAGLRVLMVEDNAVNMMIGVAMLEKWGVNVTQASDGIEGMAAVERAAAANQLFDAVLMDVQMPRLSGYEAARQLRRVHSADELPIIALTAAALVSEREEAFAAGMNDFLTKPIDAQRLKSALIRAIG